jgi:GNAT superfamily N-acetyltransferase
MTHCFQELTHENLPAYAEVLLKSEFLFPDPIKFNQQDYVDILYGQESIAKIILVDGTYAGNVVGAQLHPVEIAELGLTEECSTERLIYLYGFVIEPEFQGRGFGTKLLREFLDTAARQGYTQVIGHFRNNASLAIIRKCGCVERSLERDWCGSGEDFVFCSLSLDQKHLSPATDQQSRS